MKGIIYKYTNKINGKSYIGQTNRPRQRVNEHRCHSLSPNKKVAFYNAVKKYGWDNFTYEILEELEAEDSAGLNNLLNIREIFWIEFYKTRNKNFGYNESAGGPSRGACGKSISVYDKSGNLIETLKDYHQVVDKYNVSPSTIFHALNTEDALFKGKYILCYFGEEFSYGGSKKSKHIYYQYDLQGNLIKTWDSVCDIERELGYCPSTIIKCCIHPDKYKTYKGYKWSRANKL